MSNLIPFHHAGHDSEGLAIFSDVRKFEVGKKYSCRSVCDYDSIFTFEVISRTKKTVVLRGDFCSQTKIQKKGIKIRDGVETIAPLGVYSMSPVLRAEGCA